MCCGWSLTKKGIQQGSTSVCVCVCKIKWQAECSASTNTGASARMKGAVTMAHGGKEEKYIHPRSSPLHLSPPLPMHLLRFCFSIHMGYIKKGNHCFSHPVPCGTFLQYICFPVLTTLLVTIQNGTLHLRCSKCAVLKHFSDIFLELIRSIECA